MDMDILITAARDEAFKRAADSLSELISEAEEVTLEKESLRRFTLHLSRLRALLQELGARRVEARSEWGSVIAALQMLEADVKKARNVIRSCNSGSQLRLLLKCRAMLSRLQQSAGEIASGVQLLALANLDASLELKSRAEEIIHGMESLQFSSATATEAVVAELEKSVSQNHGRDQTRKLLWQIAEAVGAASPDTPSVRREVELLKQEKEELEERKQHAEAFQLSQLMQLLYGSEMAPSPTRETPASTSVISSFTCPLSGEVMDDPVAIVCGHSFERKAIIQHFGRGETACPTCREDLPSLEVTVNISLRGSIQEWKQRAAQQKLQNALHSITSNETGIPNQTLEDLCSAMETPSCVDQVMKEQGIVQRLVDFLKSDAANSKAVLKCLCYLARHSEENKEVIAESGVIRCIVRQFCRGETDPEAMEILLLLSQNEALAEQIGKTKDSIPSLVPLLQNSNPDISENARKVLDNLSFSTHFVIKMAEAGQFEPFLARFNKELSETRASMAAELTRMQLSESAAENFEDEQFIGALTKMLYSNSPACKAACLRCIKKLTAFDRLVKQFLVNRDIIPALLGLMSSIGSEPLWKQEATEILISLVQACQASDYQTNLSLQELHSEHNIHVFLHLSSASKPQTRATLLQLLLAIVQKSEIARNLIRSDENAMTSLFSTLIENNQDEVRLQALKLIYSTAEGNPNGILLPTSDKETVLNNLINTFTSSLNNEERSIAAAIIGRLPTNDATVENMLWKSETLKVIHQLISDAVDSPQGMTKEPPPAATPNFLLENALAALLQYTEPTKLELQRQVVKLDLYPSLIRVLSTGSSLAKQRTAVALARLSQTTATLSDTEEQLANFVPLPQLTRLLHIKSWCCSHSAAFRKSLCSVHGSTCSSRRAFCLIRADAVRPLVQTLSETESGAAEAALVAIDTLLMDDPTISYAIKEIRDNQGVDAILQVLGRGSQPAKDKALDLFLKILQHSTIRDAQFQRSKGILIHLLQDDSLKKKAAQVLSQMDIIPQQSSYF